VITTTTHKTLRGPRGAMIMTDAAHASAIDKAVFPGLQGGPHNHTTAGIAVALREASQPSFRTYAAQVVANAAALADALLARGYDLVSGGTDNHLLLVDLRPFGVTGKVAQEALDAAGITTNKNAIPNDPEKPFVTSGIRIGSPAMTTRGFADAEAAQVAHFVADVLDAHGDAAALAKVGGAVQALCARFPVYGPAMRASYGLSAAPGKVAA